MSILPLVQIDTSQIINKELLLRKPCDTVTDFGEAFQKQVNNLIETFRSHKIAVGLAAPQVGIYIRLAVINISKDKQEEDLIIVNPKVIAMSGKKDRKNESCMSVPNYAGAVERRRKISISYQDQFWETQKLDADGFLARVLFHEIDHLEGILYIDRMSDLSALETTDIFKYD